MDLGDIFTYKWCPRYFIFLWNILWFIRDIFTNKWSVTVINIWIQDVFCPLLLIFMSFNRRFHPRVAPRLTFCSSNFFMCFDGRFHPRVAPHLSKCQMGHKWSTNKVTVISNGGPNWSLIRKFNLVSPAQHWNPVVHSLATCGLRYLWQGVL